MLCTALLLAGCGSDDDDDPIGDPDIPDDGGVDVGDAGDVPDGGNPPQNDVPGAAVPPAGTPSDGNAPLADGWDWENLPDGLEDNSPTEVESLSLRGPSQTDPSRGSSPPSAPGALTGLLFAGNWVEFSWAPSVDDSAVAAYEVYRDGRLLQTITGDTENIYEYRDWLTTSYIDCNYTRNPDCETQQPATGSVHDYYVVAIDDNGLRSQPSETATFELVEPGSEPVDLGGFEMVFADEFDGTTLDRGKWKTVLPWGADTIINGEMQYFANLFGSDPIAYDPFVFNGETLAITGVETPPELLEDARGQPYLSGVITSADNFAFTYGYVEMSARLAGGQGLLSTFYLFNDEFDGNKPEIDIVEYIGSRQSISYQTYHYYDSLLLEQNGFQGVKHSTPTMSTDTAVDLGAGFHTYGMLWQRGSMVWYIDGLEVRRVTGPRVSDEPMNIIAHLVIGSNWIGDPAPASGFPATYEIDYIRAWQRN